MRVTLDGVEFALRFDYSGREDRWYLSVSVANTGEQVRRGMKVQANWDLLRLSVHPSRPPGALLFLDVRREAGSIESPGLYSFGRTVKLVYLSGDLTLDDPELAEIIEEM